ncbi:zinc knuckle CX2CX4HX4C containing protein [Tanacetum coccineum]
MSDNLDSGKQVSGSTSDVHATYACNKETNQGRGIQVGNNLANKFTSSFASKLSPTSLVKDNLWKLVANVPNNVDYDIWIPLASLHEVNDRMKNSLYGYIIGERLAFPVVEWFMRNNWKKYALEKVTLVKVSLLKDELLNVPVWVKFHDVPMVAYIPDGLSLMATKTSTLMMLHFDQLVMAVPNMEENGYTKETIRIEYEWEPLCCSTCLIFGHSIDDCLKATKRVVNRVDKDKGRSSGADDEGFIEVKKKKLGGNNGGNSSKRASTTSTLPSGNGTFSLSNSFKVLKVDDPANMEVESCNKASMSSVQEEGQSATPLVEKINMFEKHILEGTCLLVDDDGKPLKKSRVGYGTKSLLEQYRETYGNVEYDYDPYDDDLYEDHEVLVAETFHEQTDDELTKKEVKQMEADDQAIQTILIGFPEDIYAAVDSCETGQEIWLRVQQMMKGSVIGVQEKKAKLFNEWERFTSTDRESINSYYHRFLKLRMTSKETNIFHKRLPTTLSF